MSDNVMPMTIGLMRKHRKSDNQGAHHEQPPASETDSTDRGTQHGRIRGT